MILKNYCLDYLFIFRIKESPERSVWLFLFIFFFLKKTGFHMRSPRTAVNKS